MAEVRRVLVERGPDLALIGVSIVVVASFMTAIVYSGTDGEPYRAANHTISELGELGVSALALVFDLGLIVGGVLMAGFLAGRALVADDRVGRGFWIVATLAALAMAAVGLLPVDLLEPHVVAAAAAFLLVLASSSWFVVWTAHARTAYPRTLRWLAAWVAAAMLLFLVVPSLAQPEHGFEIEFGPDTPRPDVLLYALLEWVAVGSAWLWVAALAWHHREAA